MTIKSKSIKGATDKELDALIIRLRKEAELQQLVAGIKRKSTPKDPLGNYVSYDQPEISTEVPIEDLYHKTNEALVHYGILGMKWGVRRKTDSRGLVGGSGSSGRGSSDYVKSRELKKKGSKNLSNKELQTLTQRMQLEKQLRDLNASDLTKGHEAVKAVVAVGTTAATIYTLASSPLGQVGKKALMSALKK